MFMFWIIRASERARAHVRSTRQKIEWMDSLKKLGPANQIIPATPPNCSNPLPIFHYHLAPTDAIKIKKFAEFSIIMN